MAAREVRVGDKREPTSGHAFEAEERLHWDADEDLRQDVVVVCDLLGCCVGSVSTRHSLKV